MPRIVQVPTPEELKKKLNEQLDWARKHRETTSERQWEVNGAILDSSSGSSLITPTESFDGLNDLEQQTANDYDIGMNYAFKYIRFLHSQLSANPPSAEAKPTSSDPEDKRSADAADRILRHIRKDKKMQEVVDQATLKTLKKSIGWVKVFWNPDKGEIYDFNEETREVTMEGDLDVYSPATEDVWIDPDATRWEEIKYTFERLRLREDEAIFRFPESATIIKERLSKKRSNKADIKDDNESYAPMLEVYEYYEKGLPVNGGIGMRAYVLDDGTLLEMPTKNPHVNAGLPLKALTYIDREESLYCQSVVEYVAPLQDTLNRIDSSILDNIRAHGIVRMVLPAGAEVEDGSISTDAFDYIKSTGNQAPHFMNTPQLMPDIWRHRESLMQGIQDIVGINDSMMGIQRREQSAVSQQTSIESGTAIHRRLFVKYSMFVEEIYMDCLGLVQENWDTPRTVKVVGKEKAFDVADFRGADIAGGYDLIVDYGTSLPIDPTARREFLLLNMPMFKEAGVSAKELLKLMKLNDVGGAFDRVELAADRQKEVFEEMEMHFKKGKPIYIPPEEGEDHLSRLDYARTYVETSEFKYLPEDLKGLIRQHIKDRKQLAAAEVAPAPGIDPSIMPAGMPGVDGALGPELLSPLEDEGII